MQLAKCIQLGNQELEQTQLKLIEKNINQLSDIEKKGIEKANDLIEKLNSFKENLPVKLEKLRQKENEKLKELKEQFESQKKDIVLAESLESLNSKENSDLLNIKKELDKKLSVLKLNKKINQSKMESGAEFKLITLDDSILENLSGLFLQMIPPSVLVILLIRIQICVLCNNYGDLIKAEKNIENIF